jgi:hypothetical protein
LLTVSITHDDLDIPAAAASMSQRISSATTVPRPATTQSATVVRYYLSLPTNSPVDPLQKQALSTFLLYPRKERPRNFISPRSYGAAEVSVHLRSELSLDSVSCYPLAALLQRDTCSGLSACAAGRRTGGLSQQSIPPCRLWFFTAPAHRSANLPTDFKVMSGAWIGKGGGARLLMGRPPFATAILRAPLP